MREFAVPTIEIEDNIPFVRLWFPADGPVNLDSEGDFAPVLTIQDDAFSESIAFQVRRSRDPYVWLLTLDFARETEPEDPGAWFIERLRAARLKFIFNVVEIAVTDGNQGELYLIDAMTEGGYSYAGYDRHNHIVVPLSLIHI